MFCLLFLMLAFSPSSVLCMEDYEAPSKAEIVKAYAPIPRPTLTDTHDIAPFCTQMAVRLHRQPIKKCTFVMHGEKQRYLWIMDKGALAVFRYISKAARKINNHAWSIAEDVPEELLKQNPRLRGQIGHYMIFTHGDAGDSKCSIAQLGQLYEKVVTTIRGEWSFTPSEQNDPAAWTFSKSTDLSFVDGLLMSHISHLLNARGCHWKFYNTGNSLRCTVSIEKEHFQAVQSKLQFDLPSKSELEALQR